MSYEFDFLKYEAVSRKVAAEGAVLLKNDRNALPVQEGETVSVFGRIQLETYYCGTGSGGMVNAPYVVSAIDGIRAQCKVNEELAEIYKTWLAEHPFVAAGWAREPWSQEEMPLTKEVAEAAAKKSDLAIVIIGRTAGEDQDSGAEKGSYYLTDLEEQMLGTVRAAFSRVVVLMNIGGTMDMAWVAKYNPDALMVTWHGGCETGNAIADVVTGRVNPCGRLTDTIACSLEDYPAYNNFGSKVGNYYQEDIYLGYRYFETFAPEKVLYPFGFGLSYTTFSLETNAYVCDSKEAFMTLTVRNTGNVAGKQVVQLYVEAPQGKLGKPSRVLLDFAKTRLLEPGESQQISFTVPVEELASFDDAGKTGHSACWVVEEGDYKLRAGWNVRTADVVGIWNQPALLVTEVAHHAMTPTKNFNRMVPMNGENGSLKVAYEHVPTRTYDLEKRRLWKGEEIVREVPETPYMWDDVRTGKVSLKKFLNQLSNEDLACMCRGQGMFSPRVTAGTASAFGGISTGLEAYGMPAICCSDGPSGIRMDCGSIAFSMPNGTCVASTYDRALISELYSYLALELVMNRINTLLGPGVNIHRYPLCGRNFEYFSEDPRMTGYIACAVLDGLHTQNLTGTIKHFACNNQEYKRFWVNAYVSERAIREIYLKAFEICVKKGHARSIMTSYNPTNGIWSASNYDLLTVILRGEWKYTGMVMTDWWAMMNGEGGEHDMPSQKNTAAMIRGQNDVYMVISDPEHNGNGDNTMQAIADGRLTRAELLRSAENLARVMLKTNASIDPDAHKKLKVLNFPKCSYVPLAESVYSIGCDKQILENPVSNVRGSRVLYRLTFAQSGTYHINYSLHCDLAELAQEPVSFFRERELMRMVMLQGVMSESDAIEFQAEAGETMNMEIYFGGSGSIVDELSVEKI